MIVGVVSEIKKDEYRVGLVPSGVEMLVRDGNTVLVQSGCGVASCCTDEMYSAVGGQIVQSAAEVWQRSDMIIKVKEPQASEFPYLRKDLILFTYFHFAANKPLLDAVMASGCVAIAYETVEDKSGSTVLLVPMSEVAGRMAVQEGAKYLEKPFSGRGVLLCGTPGVPPGNVLVIGGGVVGFNAAKIAAGYGAMVKILDSNTSRLGYLSEICPPNVATVYSTPHTIRQLLPEADLVIGAVYVRGAGTPKLIKREDLKLMKPGSCLVDVSIDQGGIAESSHATTHSNPTYIEEGVNHYCVANIPGAVPNTSTYALTNATMPYARRIAKHGWKKALKDDAGLRKGLSVVEGKVTYLEIAEAFGLEHFPSETFL